MVIVRESPHAKISPGKNNVQWPPRSPLEALLSSPSGRQKWQSMQYRKIDRSPSPSPLKKTLGSSKALQDTVITDNEDEDDDEDEDEEMVQLRLQALQAKIKLKKLQKKARKDSNQDVEHAARYMSTIAKGRSASPSRAVSGQRSLPQIANRTIEVPVSPTKNRLSASQEHLSPAARKLGVSRVAKVEDVSLKRARDGTQIKRAAVKDSKQASQSKATSFGERLAASRTDALVQREKQARIERSRSHGFSGRESGLSKAQASIERSSESRERSGDQPRTIVSAQNPATASRYRKPRSHSQDRPSLSPGHPAITVGARSPAINENKPSIHNHEQEQMQNPPTDPASEVSSSTSFDPFSEIHLSKRNIPHVDVARAVEDSEVYTLPRLLKEVKSPDYQAPDCEGNFVVFAIIAEKSTPFNHKPTAQTSDKDKPQEDANASRNKFMVLKLCDLKWEVDCFLFGTAFDQFWKLTPGTLLAILNPSILPPKTNQHSGRFSLKLGSSDDCVMEIGLARDLGYCVSVKKDGQQCKAWIDKRSTEVCDFHITLLVDRQRRQRMEVNSNWGGAGDSEFRIRGRGREANSQNNQTKVKKKQNGACHGDFGRLYSVASGLGKSAASLLDAEDMDKLHNITHEEVSRRRIAGAQKERDLAKKLSAMGGPGAEYLQKTIFADEEGSGFRSKDMMTADAKARFEKPSIAELGFKNNTTSSNVHLSPGKDRKRHFGVGAISTSGRDAMGWGGAKTWGLLQPKESKELGNPEKGQTTLKGSLARRREDGSLSPSKKRARFVLEKGIRVPGRESLPGAIKTVKNTAVHDDDNDDDDLDIV
nr:dna replication licensing factor mcm10 [Quercus suber]